MLVLAFNVASADVYLFNIHDHEPDREPDHEPDPDPDPDHDHDRDPDHCSRIMAAFIFDSVVILYAVRTYQAMPRD